MANRIKLENILGGHQLHQHDGKDYSKHNHCPKCGQAILSQVLVEEYVCESCRHLVQLDDTFCSFCGAELLHSNKLEHNFGGVRIDQELFDIIKTKIKKV